MHVDFCVIGGGIAGLSIASELASSADVLVLERESDLAYHTTGRSAALYSELVATSLALSLSRLSRGFLTQPPAGFTQTELHREIGCIFTAKQSQQDLLRDKMQEGQWQLLDVEQLLARVPVLRTGEGQITSGLFEEGAFKIDVANLLQSYRKCLGTRGGRVRCNAEVVDIHRVAGGWALQLADREVITTGKIINAAGAWGDVVAKMAGITPLGLMPLRRTIITFDGPENLETTHWPCAGGIDGGYYFMPEAGLLLGSASDEVESPPCDAQPEEYDIALAAHSIESNTTLKISHIQHRWAGLRTFSPDRQLVACFEPANRDFFWFVGQGGVGIQTAPAAAVAAACLALEKPLPLPFEEAGVTERALSRRRLG